MEALLEDIKGQRAAADLQLAAARYTCLIKFPRAQRTQLVEGPCDAHCTIAVLRIIIKTKPEQHQFW